MALDTHQEALAISDVAARCGLTAHTLRYYEGLGLIDSIARADSGHRRYHESDLGWIEFLKRLRATGMPVEEMRRFAELRRAGPDTVTQRQRLLEEHRDRIRAEIASLDDNLAAISKKINHYAELTTSQETT